MLADCVLGGVMIGFSAWTYHLLGEAAFAHSAYIFCGIIFVLLWRLGFLSTPLESDQKIVWHGQDDGESLIKAEQPPTPSKPSIRPVAREIQSTEQATEKIILTSLVDEPIGSIRILVGASGAFGGRLNKNEIILEDSVVSRVHFQLSCVRNSFYLQDCGSTTGTFIYLAPKESRLLSMHDHVKIGDTEFLVVDASFHGKSPYLQIKFTKGPMEGITQRIGASLVTIGRRTSCTLCIENDVTVSGSHCTIQYRTCPPNDDDDDSPSGFYLTDLNSTNGTGFRLSPSGLPSEKIRLHHGDVFGVGCTRFLVQLASKLREEQASRIA